MTRRGFRAVVFVGLWIAASSVLRADYKESFRRAIYASNQKNWTEAIVFLRQAIAEQAQETGERVVISGMDFKPYLPQFYLGVALMNNKDCSSALAAWRTSEDQGTVKKSGEYNLLRRLRTSCESMMVPSNVSAARTSIEVARQSDAALAPLEAEISRLQGQLWQQDSGLGPAQAAARTALQSATARLEAGTRDSDVEQVRQAADLAVRAGEQFQAVFRQALRRRDELESERAKPLTTVSNPPLAALMPLPATPDSSSARRADLQTLPPRELVAAVDAFFKADYARALKNVSGVQPPAGPVAGQSYLIRSAAEYMLYVLGGESDAQLLENATKSVRSCRRIAPRLEPDPHFFSPRFVQFFAGVR